MKKALLLYSGVDGQTYKITLQLASRISAEFACEVYSFHDLPELDFSVYDIIVVGAAIRYGFFNGKFQYIMKKNSELFNHKKTVFFSVTLIARKLEKRSPETNLYTRKFLAKTPWKPKLCGVFAGALHYPRYKWYDRLMIQLIMKMSGGVTDATQDIEYTDWVQVDQFADQVISLGLQEN